MQGEHAQLSLDAGHDEPVHPFLGVDHPLRRNNIDF